MGKKSGIDYATASWSPWYGGCKPRGPECAHCYAKREMRSFGKDPELLTRGKTTFDSPLRWKEHKRVFVCPWSDFFLDEADQFRPEAWDVMRQAPQHVYIIPTKRPERIVENLPDDWGDGWPNVWLMLSAGTMDSLWRWGAGFLKIPAMVLGLSAEPLLESILEYPRLHKFDWIATGCESGPDRRKTEVHWVEDLVTFGENNDVPVFVKQLDLGLGEGLVKMPEVLGKVRDQYPRGYDEQEWTERWSSARQPALF